MQEYAKLVLHNVVVHKTHVDEVGEPHGDDMLGPLRAQQDPSTEVQEYAKLVLHDVVDDVDKLHGDTVGHQREPNMTDRKSTRLNPVTSRSRMPSSA